MIGVLLLAWAGSGLAAEPAPATLASAIGGSHRTPEFAARDRYRHPAQTLIFFGVQPTMTVVEIWPGQGWYTEILAPFLRPGKYYAAHFARDATNPYFIKSRTAFAAKLAANPAVYGAAILADFDPGDDLLIVPAGTADRVLTFRNVHNWMKANSAEAAFKLFFDVLKPGGVLGVVEHRAKPGTSLASMIKTGYVTENYVISLAREAGFTLDGRSEINANPKDTKDYQEGVWTLPPTLTLGDRDRAKYLAIGESDRMTLRFRKPPANSPPAQLKPR